MLPSQVLGDSLSESASAYSRTIAIQQCLFEGNRPMSFVISAFDSRNDPLSFDAEPIVQPDKVDFHDNDNFSLRWNWPGFLGIGASISVTALVFAIVSLLAFMPVPLNQRLPSGLIDACSKMPISPGESLKRANRQQPVTVGEVSAIPSASPLPQSIANTCATMY